MLIGNTLLNTNTAKLQPNTHSEASLLLAGNIRMYLQSYFSNLGG